MNTTVEEISDKEKRELIEKWNILRKCECLMKDKEQGECRNFIDFPDDFNCVMCAVEKNGEMTLVEVAERIGCSYQYIEIITKKILQNKCKKIKKLF